MKTIVRSCLFVSILFLIFTAPAPAALFPANDASLLETGTVKEVLKPDTLALDNGTTYRLENIRTPANYSPTTVDALNKTLQGKTVRVYNAHKAAPASDRYGMPLTQVVRQDGLWVQSYLVSKGLAWAFSTETSRGTVSSLLHIEAQARAKHLGFWSSHSYAIKTPDNVQGYMNSFQLVQGKVLNVTVRNDYTYVNFGLDWKTDFTINIKNTVWSLFGTGPQIWNGKTVRIRGWVEDRNGPMIELTHPEQLEFIK